jgi:hypothetical protein
VRTCPGCGFLVPPAWSICRRCGAVIDGAEAADAGSDPGADPTAAPMAVPAVPAPAASAPAAPGPPGAPPPSAGWAPPPPGQWSAPAPPGQWSAPPPGAWSPPAVPGAPGPGGPPDLMPGSAPSGRRRSRILIVVAAVVAFALAAGGLTYWFVGRTPGHHYPAHWDARIAPIATEVSRLRGLGFKHAVPVDFLSDAAFRKLVTADDQKLSASDRRELRQAEGQLRALGLVHGKVDLFSSSNQLSGSDVLAFYDPDTKRIRVRGEALDVSARVTLAHELTHVLQDQYFDLNRIQKDAQKAKASLAVTALVEGDAERIETEYVDQLSSADQEAYDKAQASQGTDIGKDISDVPPFLVASQQAPYTLGEPMVDTIKALHGTNGVDDAFRDPPRSDLEFYAPLVADGSSHPIKVPTPALRAGEKKTGTDVFGSYDLYLTFASRLSNLEALQLADGWGGDAMVEFDRGSVSCLRAAFVGRSAADTATIRGGWQRWLAAMPAAAGQVETIDGRVVVTACDPGADAKIAEPHSAVTALGFVTKRNVLGQILVGQSHFPADVAECTATRAMASRVVVAALESDQPPPPQFTTDLRAAARTCGAAIVGS